MMMLSIRSSELLLPILDRFFSVVAGGSSVGAVFADGTFSAIAQNGGSVGRLTGGWALRSLRSRIKLSILSTEVFLLDLLPISTLAKARLSCNFDMEPTDDTGFNDCTQPVNLGSSPKLALNISTICLGISLSRKPESCETGLGRLFVGLCRGGPGTAVWSRKVPPRDGGLGTAPAGVRGVRLAGEEPADGFDEHGDIMLSMVGLVDGFGEQGTVGIR
mmetsp:Transcript_16699/g.38379  ORF Transcript_16699/g.38379 Transcript_16699/m.38379 type:complete len:218 (-) Transcript_16699:1369-2022(-)